MLLGVTQFLRADITVMEEEEIDLWKDGVRVAHEKMCKRAGTDISGMMAYEMPASSMIGRDYDYRSDMHVEWDCEYDDEDDDEWDDALFAMDDDMAPDNIKEEPVPHHTESPFKLYGEEMKIPGLFGEAITAYGCAVALIESEGVDSSGYTQLFKDEWDLDDEDDDILRAVVPQLRSTGAAKWAAVGRKLTPACFAMPATSSKLRVKQHGVNRQMIGEDALIDWNRAAEVAKAITIQVVADDVFAKHKVKRLDFSIDKRKATIAPDKVQLADISDIREKSFRVKPDMSAIRAYLDQARAVAFDRSTEVRGTAVNVDYNVEFTGYDVLRAARNTTDFKMNVPDPKEVPDDFGGIWFPRDEIRILPFTGNTMTISDVFRCFARIKVRSTDFMPIREQEIFYAIEHLEVQEERDKILKLVKQVYPDTFPESAAKIWAIAKKVPGGSIVGKITKHLRVPDAYNMDHNYRRWWANVRTHRKALYRLGDAIMREVANMHRYGLKDCPVSHAAAVNADPSVALNVIVDYRRMYWAKRYIANARYDGGKRVHYQLMSAVFSKIVLNIKKDSIVEVDHGAPADVLSSAAIRYVSKRNSDYDERKDFMHKNWNEIMRGRLDKWVIDKDVEPPDPSFISIAELVDEKVKLFVDDVVKFINHVMCLRQDNMELDEEKLLVRYNPNPSIGESKVVKVRDEKHAFDRQVHVIPVVKKPVDDRVVDVRKLPDDDPESDSDSVDIPDDDEDDGDEYGDEYDDFDDFEEEEAQVPTIDLATELLDDFPKASISDVSAAVAKHGARIPVSEYDAIKDVFEEKRKAEFKARVLGVFSGKIDVDEGGDDIE